MLGAPWLRVDEVVAGLDRRSCAPGERVQRQVLVAGGYRVAGGPNNIRDLFRLLNNRRVDAIMLPEQTALTVIQENSYPLQNYQFKTMRELPFAIYISKRFLEKEPDFMAQLNNAIAEYQQTKTASP